MADQDEAQGPPRAQRFQQVQHLGLHRRVQRRRGFVQQQHGRLQDQRAGDGDTLALPTRQLVRVAEAEPCAQAHFVQRTFNALLLVTDAVDGQWLGQDAVHRLPRMQAAVRILEDHLHLASPGWAARCHGNRRTGEPDGACRARRQATERAQHRALARARFADDAEALTRGDAERHTIDGDEAVEDDLQAGHVDAGLRGAHADHSGRRSSVGSGWRGAPSCGRQFSRPRV